MRIPHSSPTLGTQDQKHMLQVLKTGQLAQGKHILAFEKKISQYVGLRHAVAVNSGTSALHLSLIALGIFQGDEIIIPSFVCTALLNACHYVGAKAVVVDVNANDFNISLDAIKKKITRKTKAIVVPHMFGSPADIKAIVKLGVPVIEDLAQSLGADLDGKKLGAFGCMAICSFYATKLITTGEGGMVLSNDHKLLDKIRDLRSYDKTDRYALRYNYKMTDFQAALGISQLSKLPAFIKRRKQIAQIYSQQLQCPQLSLPEGKEHIFFRYVIKHKNNKAAELIQFLRTQGIDAQKPIFKPLHQYLKRHDCPRAEQLMKASVSIPIYPNLKENQIQYFLRVMKQEMTQEK